MTAQRNFAVAGLLGFAVACGDEALDARGPQPPSVIITDDHPMEMASGAVTFTFSFSTDVGTSFAMDDIEVDGGTPSAFNRITGLEATVVVTPLGAEGTIRVTLPEGRFEDARGVSNVVAAWATQRYRVASTPDTVVYDFESAPQQGLAFAGLSATRVSDPEDPNNTVLRLDRAGDATTFAGAVLLRCPGDRMRPIPLDGRSVRFSARVWSPQAGLTFRFKVEQLYNSAVAVETDVVSTVDGGWETMIFDLRRPAPGTRAIDDTKVYDGITVFPDFGRSGAEAGEQTFYVDDVTMLGVRYDTTCPALPASDRIIADFESDGAAAMVLGFEGAEDSTIVADPEDADNRVVRVVKSDTAEFFAGTLVYTDGANNYRVDPIRFGPGKTRMMMRVWVPTAFPTTVMLRVENGDDNARFAATTATPLEAQTWQTLIFDFSLPAEGSPALSFTEVYDRIAVYFNFGLDGDSGGAGTYYFDDVRLAD